MKNKASTVPLFRWRNVIFILFIIGIFISLKNTILFEAILEGDLQKIKRFVGDNLVIILLFSTFIMVIQNTFTIIPLLLVITINVTSFGFILGFLWSWITSILAGAIIFFLVRYFFQQWLLNKVDERLVKKVESKGFIYVFEARVFPFVPTSLVNILAGVSSIRFTSFLFGTILGNFIYFFVLALIPAGLLSSSINYYLLGGLFLLFLIIYYIYSKNRVKRHSATSTKETYQTNKE